jgi:hypothetical protein
MELLHFNKRYKETRFFINRSYIEIIVYYVMRSKNEVLCAAAGRLAAERSEADKPAKAHIICFKIKNPLPVELCWQKKRNP